MANVIRSRTVEALIAIEGTTAREEEDTQSVIEVD